MNPLHVVYGVIIALVLGYVYHCETLRDREAIRADQAEEALAAAEAETDRLKKAKEDADEKTNADRRRIAVLVKRLRERPDSGAVPPAPATSKRPDLAAFDRAEYQRAYGTLVAGLRGLADEGTAAVVDLNGAKEWSSNALRPRQSE